MEKYRDRFAPSLSLVQESGTITIACESASSNRSLPASSEESALALVALSPLLSECTEIGRLEHLTFHQALALSVLVALDRFSRLVLPASQPALSQNPGLSATPEMVGPHGYLPIPSFAAGTADYVAAALRDFNEQDVHALVVDLRGNGGGLVTEISQVLGHFCSPGTHLFSVRGRAASNSADHTATGSDLVPNASIAVLVDRSTTSGGELAALALRQLRRTPIVGEPTAGYEAIQTVYPLGNGWGAAITTAVWIAPGNARIPETGVLPNVLVEPEDDPPTAAAVDHALARALELLPD